ncbi:MAG: hypothetical protein IIB22_05875 [Chloroflexi bacterium]|nr:hypothetical protein [Chloroflexota bacterium]
MNDNEFVNIVSRKLEELSLKERELQASLTRVAEDRRKYQAALDIWSKEMVTEGGEFESRLGTSSLTDEELALMSIPQAIEKLLEITPSHRMKTSEIARRLRVAGTTTAKKANTAYSITHKTLNRRTDVFKQVGTGEWGLVINEAASVGVEQPFVGASAT